jgi:nicotinate-nucleotide adenylyltransferase
VSAAAGRVGVLGGTFDPVHFGHLAAAETAASVVGLDRVLFVPSNRPPHRQAAPFASTFHRFAMVSLMVASRPRLVASEIELLTVGPSYTAVTLRTLHGLGFRPSQLFFITGTDAFAEIATWHDYPAVLSLANFVVIARPGQSFPALRERLPELVPMMQVVDPSEGAPPGQGPPCVLLVPAHTPDISSTDIRARVRDGAPLAGLVAPEVERHIRKHELYASEA